MPHELTFGSLFAGIGGFDLGLERAGMRCLWQSEIDSYCQRVLEKHWPDVLRVPDVRDVNRTTVPQVDVICGGSPCQGFSGAGLGLGLQDERSALWFEMLRVVRDLRPRYVILENVSALLVRGFDVVLGGLAACGYDAEWDCIPASAVGAPHRRDRLWLVAYPSSDVVREQPRRVSGQGGPGAAFAGVNGTTRHVAHTSSDDGGPGRPWGSASGGTRESKPVRAFQDVGYSNLTGLEGRRGHDERSDERTTGPSSAGAGDWWLAEPDVGRVAHGIPNRVDRLRALGNSLVPQIPELIGRRILEWEEERLMAQLDALSRAALARMDVSDG